MNIPSAILLHVWAKWARQKLYIVVKIVFDLQLPGAAIIILWFHM